MIYWQDAYVTTDDKPALDGIDGNLTVSIGWLSKKDKKYTYLSHFFDGIAHELGSPFTAIPNKMIRDKYELEIK